MTESLVPELMLPLTLFLAGFALRAREVMTARLAAQAADIEAEQDVYAQLSVRYERARIAAELHDVVAHAISVMVVQASAGQRLAVVEPELANETLTVIAAAARQAEADLDRLAGLLSQDAPDSEADLLLVTEIVDRANAAGLPVTLRLEGNSNPVRGAVAHTVFRVVQEGLTNALRYAPGAPINVRISAEPAALDLNIANPAPVTEGRLNLGSGHGLTGLRERVAACGGILEAGPDGQGGWTFTPACRGATRPCPLQAGVHRTPHPGRQLVVIDEAPERHPCRSGARAATTPTLPVSAAGSHVDEVGVSQGSLTERGERWLRIAAAMGLPDAARATSGHEHGPYVEAVTGVLTWSRWGPAVRS